MEKDRVLFINTNTFKIFIKDKTCDILQSAVRRYSRIIAQNTIEEAYQSVFNFNEKTRAFQEKRSAMKYKNVHPMNNLEIHVSSTECGYPHLNMDESCKYMHLLKDIRLI